MILKIQLLALRTTTTLHHYTTLYNIILNCSNFQVMDSERQVGEVEGGESPVGEADGRVEVLERNNCWKEEIIAGKKK